MRHAAPGIPQQYSENALHHDKSSTEARHACRRLEEWPGTRVNSLSERRKTHVYSTGMQHMYQTGVLLV